MNKVLQLDKKFSYLIFNLLENEKYSEIREYVKKTKRSFLDQTKRNIANSTYKVITSTSLKIRNKAKDLVKILINKSMKL